jgi:hypothetical protein
MTRQRLNAVGRSGLLREALGNLPRAALAAGLASSVTMRGRGAIARAYPYGPSRCWRSLSVVTSCVMAIIAVAMRDPS